MSFLARTHTRTELQYPYRDVCDRVSVHYCFSASCCSKRQRQVVQRCLLSLRLLYCCVTGNIHMLGDITFKWYGKRRSKVQSNKLSCCWHYESHLKKLSAELNNVLAGIRHYDLHKRRRTLIKFIHHIIWHNPSWSLCTYFIPCVR